MRSPFLGAVVFAVLGACSGADGKPGAPGAAGETGPTGPAAEGVAASAGIVTPSHGLLERELDVTVSVNAGAVDASAVLDFGQGIAVSDLRVLTPRLLGAHLKIAADAAVGARDVKITAAGHDLVSTGAFEVRPAVEARSLGASLAGGGVVVLELTDLETSALSGFRGFDSGLTLLKVDPGTQTRSRVTAWAMIDPVASGAVRPRVLSTGETTLRLAPLQVAPANVTPLAPTLATPATKARETLAVDYAGNAYKLAATEGAVLRVRLANVGGGVMPDALLFRKGGKGEDVCTRTADVDIPLSATGGEFYWSLYNTRGAGGTDAAYQYDVTASAVAMPRVAEVSTDHSTLATAQVVPMAANAVVIDGEITATEADFYKFTTTAATQLAIFSEGRTVVQLWTPAGVLQVNYLSGGCVMNIRGSGYLGAATGFYVTVGPTGMLPGYPASSPGKYHLALFP